MVRPILLAFNFLTRLPIPIPSPHRQADLASAARAFPLVGLVIGALLAGEMTLLNQQEILASWLTFITWVLVTGGLHHDGLADVVDGLGAAHGGQKRFLDIAKDPHIGALGTVAIVTQLLSVLVLLLALRPDSHWGFWPLLLIPAWARWGAVATASIVPAVGSGMAASLGMAHKASSFGWLILLAAASAWLAPILLICPAIIAVQGLWWRQKLGGANGDCLGAGILITETILLAALAGFTGFSN